MTGTTVEGAERLPIERRFEEYERRIGRLRTAAVVAIISQAVSFFLYSYAFWQPPDTRFLTTYSPMCADPLTHASVDTPQARHRMLGPVIAYALGLRGQSGQAVLVVATTVFLGVLYTTARRYFSAAESALLCLLMGTTPVVTTSQTWLGYPDILSQLALLVCLRSGDFRVIGPALLLGMLADERCVAATPLVLLWHYERGHDRRPLRTAVLRGLAACAAFGIWLVFYRWVQTEFVRPDPTFDNKSFLADIRAGRYAKAGALYLPGAAFYVLRAAWLLPLMCWGQAAIDKRLVAVALGVAATGLAMLPGALVGDQSRCMAVAWPIVLIVSVTLRDKYPESFRLLLLSAFVLNAGTPMYEVFNVSGFHLRLPMLLALGRALV